MGQLKINQLEIENVKRIKAVTLIPSANGLTIIGGDNGQGKTSVIDAIAWALGGDRFKPTSPKREGSSANPTLKITLSNGIVVERKGKNSELKVTDSHGKKAGQQLLNCFIEQLALNLPKFMNAPNKEKADILLRIIGIGEKLAKLEHEEQSLYNERRYVGQVSDKKRKYADEMVFYPDAPKDLVSPSELIKQQQEILARNGENARKRERASYYEYTVSTLTDEVARLQNALAAKQRELEKATNDLTIAKTDAMDLVDQSTEELERNIANIEAINAKVRSNMEKAKAEDEASELERQYSDLTVKIEKVRNERYDLLNNASLPLPGLSVEGGELTYQGKKWDSMSGSEQLIVSTAIVRKLNPNCGFVLMDKLEQMDIQTLNRFGEWLTEQGLQVIGTRVSQGDECSIIIEDGYSKPAPEQVFDKPVEIEEPSLKVEIAQPSWKAGMF